MQLMTEELQAKIPKIGETSEQSATETQVHLKIFDPCGSWTWYVTEYAPETGECFGFVDGHSPELGYFNLKELQRIEGPLGLGMERDILWRSTTLREVMDACKA
tara:strand:+ start:591 stop:902 length:312 start_codon:yes stop_codon:yes gene_type:complete